MSDYALKTPFLSYESLSFPLLLLQSPRLHPHTGGEHLQSVHGVPDKEDHQGGDDEKYDQDEDAHYVFLINFGYFPENNSSRLLSQLQNSLSEHVHDSNSVNIITEHILGVGQSAIFLNIMKYHDCMFYTSEDSFSSPFACSLLCNFYILECPL